MVHATPERWRTGMGCDHRRRRQASDVSSTSEKGAARIEKCSGHSGAAIVVARVMAAVGVEPTEGIHAHQLPALARLPVSPCGQVKRVLRRRRIRVEPLIFVLTWWRSRIQFPVDRAIAVAIHWLLLRQNSIVLQGQSAATLLALTHSMTAVHLSTSGVAKDRISAETKRLCWLLGNPRSRRDPYSNVLNCYAPS